MKKILFILVIFILFSSWYFFGRGSDNENNTDFVVSSGQGVNEISNNLFDNGLIKNKFIFETYIWLKGLESKFQAGSHEIEPDMNFWEVVKKLTSKGEVKEREIKILEGWSNWEIGEYLEEENLLARDEFLEIVGNYNNQDEYTFLSDLPEDATLEGYLFPDTYRIYDKKKSESNLIFADHIITKMLDNFDKKLTQEMRDEIKNQGKSLFDILRMASVVEKEVATVNDKAIVADIFWKRFNAGMPLQSDATVNYITHKNITRSSLDDLKIDSLYNTYKYKGLPKGPIGNPGIEAIKATIYPEKNNYWYFLTTEEGEVIYSRNFEEHKFNRAKYFN